MKNTYNFVKWALAIILLFSLSESFARNQVTGKVVYSNLAQTPLSGVEVHLLNLNNILLETTISNDSGYFFFYDMPVGTYTITASSNQILPDVVDLLDVSLLIDYLNGLISFEPLKEKVADVDGVNGVDAADLDFIMDNWYLNGEPFPVGNWVFEEQIALVGGKGGEITVNGACVADVIMDFEPEKKSQFLMANLNPIPVSPFSIMELPMKSNSNVPIKNFYIEMAYDPSTIEDISIEAHLPGMKFSIAADRIKIIWADVNGKGMALNTYEDLFTIRLRTNDIYAINPEDLWFTNNCSFVSSKNEFTSDVALQVPKANNLSLATAPFSNYPNPALSSTTFQYDLQTAGDVKIELVDTYGSVVKSIRPGTQGKGANTYTLDQINLNPGIYFSRLYLNNKAIACKPLIIR